jgi:single-stranded DNA-binding protein
MSIAAMLLGKLVAAPQQRQTSTGKAYTLGRLQVRDRAQGQLYVTLFAYSDTPRRLLLALDAGTEVAVSGQLEVGVWTPKDSGEPRLSVGLTVDGVLTLYERRAAQKRVAQARQDPSSHADPVPAVHRPEPPGAGGADTGGDVFGMESDAL